MTQYAWKTFNPSYGPWYRLRTTADETIIGGEVVCMPDMDGSRWFWSVRIGSRDEPMHRFSGHESTLEEAKRVARAKFDAEYPW